jgi:hypothetical protein
MNNIVAYNDCDIFFQTYEGNNTEEALNIIKPKKFLIESSKKDFSVPDYCYLVKAQETNIENIYFMWRNVKKSIDLVTDGYHSILRTRTDIIYTRPLVIDENLMKYIWIPRGGDHRNGLFDMFAVSSVENMKFYSSIYENLSEYMDHGILGHPETLLKYHLLYSNKKYVQVQRFDYELHLSRDSPNRHYIIANHLNNQLIRVDHMHSES